MSWRDILKAVRPKRSSHSQNSHNTQNSRPARSSANSADYADYADYADSNPKAKKSKFLEALLNGRILRAGTSTQNSHNTQNPHFETSSADSTDCAYGDPEKVKSQLLDALANGCRGLPITPTEVWEQLADEDIYDWHNGVINADTLTTFARSVVHQQMMDRGECPDHYTAFAECQHCGPVWSWRPGEVEGCPWCRNRLYEKPIPRPVPVRCGDCFHFNFTNNPPFGYCQKGVPGAAAGLSGSDPRECARFIPAPMFSVDGNHN